MVDNYRYHNLKLVFDPEYDNQEIENDPIKINYEILLITLKVKAWLEANGFDPNQIDFTPKEIKPNFIGTFVGNM